MVSMEVNYSGKETIHLIQVYSVYSFAASVNLIRVYLKGEYRLIYDFLVLLLSIVITIMTLVYQYHITYFTNGNFISELSFESLRYMNIDMALIMFVIIVSYLSVVLPYRLIYDSPDDKRNVRRYQ